MDGWKWVIFSPENYPAEDFYNDIIEMYAGKNVTDTWGNKMTLQEYQEACDFVNEHMIFIYPEDAHTIDRLHELVQHEIKKHGIDGVLIDPYNQVERDLPGERDDREISEFMRKVKKMAVTNNLAYNIIAHPKSPKKNDQGQFDPADTYDIAGGAMWANKADNVVSYHRPNWFTDKNDPTVTVSTQKLKRKRTGGKLDTITLYFDYTKAGFYEKIATGSKYLCDPKRKIDYDSTKNIDTSFDFGDWDKIETSNN